VWGTNDTSILLLDLWRGKWIAPDLRDKAKAIWNKWKNGRYGVPCSAFYIEDKSSGTGLIQDIQSETKIPVIGIPRVKDKLTRVENVLTYIESGRVLLPIGPEYSFNPLLLSECADFSRDMTHAHDDMIDVMIDAINIGLKDSGHTTLVIGADVTDI
jgi:predicted phage terminase large subunit-like protein